MLVRTAGSLHLSNSDSVHVLVLFRTLVKRWLDAGETERK